ncbi:MAG: hypothetical protein VX028_04390 [Nanoarchaeota archaeon]|nr:hypothetical protein [Nanoarchaeota archaeon]MEC8339368.1 hypothetical protein [Nanoarchaeota archaeon]
MSTKYSPFNKTGQVKFGETIGIIFIVYILIMVGFTWYNSITQDDFAELQEDVDREAVFDKYNFIVQSSFLRKSQGTDTENVMDYRSFMAFYNYSQTEDGKRFLRSRLGEGMISIYFYEINEQSQLVGVDLDGENGFNKIEDTLIIYNYTRDDGSRLRKQENVLTTFPVDFSYRKEKLTRIGVLSLQSYFYE